jgi:hypothetical protein
LIEKEIDNSLFEVNGKSSSLWSSRATGAN